MLPVDLGIRHEHQAQVEALGIFAWLPEGPCRYEFSVRATRADSCRKPVLKLEASTRWMEGGKNHSYFVEHDWGLVGSEALGKTVSGSSVSSHNEPSTNPGLDETWWVLALAAEQSKRIRPTAPPCLRSLPAGAKR